VSEKEMASVKVMGSDSEWGWALEWASALDSELVKASASVSE
jgi:hypothetical protein